MKSKLINEKLNFYQDYFDRYCNYLIPLSIIKKPKLLSNQEVYKLFENALLNIYPSALYKWAKFLL